MDQAAPSAFPGSRQVLLKKSFKLFIRYMLTACSTEEFFKAFSTYDKSKQEALYQLFIQVINSLHHDIEVFNCFGQHFCLHFEAFLLGMAPVYMAFLRFMGDDNEAKNFSYSLEVGGNGSLHLNPIP